jgi:hypothetical protein
METKETEVEKDFFEVYVNLIKISIDEEGIKTPHAALKDRDNKLTLAAMLGLTPQQTYAMALYLFSKEKPVQMAFGLDRFNKEGQGIDMKYSSVFTVIYFDGSNWKTAVMPYTSKDEVGEIQFGNEFWNNSLKYELKLFGFIDPEVSDEIIGAAYSNKLNVTHYREDEELRLKFYEGIINPERLDDVTKKFLADNSLDINKREEVISFLRKNGHSFEFEVEKGGLWNLRADKLILPARTSRTKAYLEGVESIANSNVPKEEK